MGWGDAYQGAAVSLRTTKTHFSNPSFVSSRIKWKKYNLPLIMSMENFLKYVKVPHSYPSPLLGALSEASLPKPNPGAQSRAERSRCFPLADVFVTA